MKRRSASMIAIAAVCAGLLAGAGAASGTQAAAAAPAAPGGTWGNAEEVAAGLNQGGEAQLNSVSCASPGNCAVAGSYQGAARSEQVFVADETNGTWGTAAEAPGTAALNGGGLAVAFEVSCGAVASCSAAGFYTDTGPEAFVISETPGGSRRQEVSWTDPRQPYGPGARPPRR